MMTLKLVQDGRTRIHEAASFTITNEDDPRLQVPQPTPISRKITAHDLVGGEDACWWIGAPPYEVEPYRVYDVAYVMNGGGKTIEILSVPVAHQSTVVVSANDLRAA